ncbi:response regulator [Verrucomicrobiota bacterium]
MPIKPRRVYDPALGKMVSTRAGYDRRKTGSAARQPQRVYQSGDNKDRLGITQQIVEFTESRKSRLATVSLSKYEELLNTIYDAVFMTDESGNIFECNARAEHYFSMPKKSICRLNVLDLISGSDEQLLNTVNENAAHKQYSVIEAICISSDQSRFPAEIVVDQLKSAEHSGLCFFIRDITARQQAEEELQEASERLVESEKVQARIDTMSTLLCELNNPLQVLTCMAELDENKEYKKQLDRIVSALNQLSSGEDLKSVVDSTGETRYAIKHDKELAECDYSKILVADDEETLQRLFVNSISAAFPEVAVDSAKDGQSACLSFSENHYGLIIMDVSMPVMGGEDAFREIQSICQQKSWREPVFIFITGFGISDDLNSIIDDGSVHTYIQKPISLSGLIDAVRKKLPQ